MPTANDSPASMLPVDWISLAVLFAIYALILAAVRWKPSSVSSTVTQYSSPAGISLPWLRFFGMAPLRNEHLCPA
jgi:hypothetical protein